MSSTARWTISYQDVPKKETGQGETSLTCIFTAYFSVELPGIEPGAEIGFTC
jgi:hypothetical protein